MWLSSLVEVDFGTGKTLEARLLLLSMLLGSMSLQSLQSLASLDSLESLESLDRLNWVEILLNIVKKDHKDKL